MKRRDGRDRGLGVFAFARCVACVIAVGAAFPGSEPGSEPGREPGRELRGGAGLAIGQVVMIPVGSDGAPRMFGSASPVAGARADAHANDQPRAVDGHPWQLSVSERMTRAAHAVLRASRMSGERSSGERAGANHVPVGRDPREPPGGWGMELAPRAGARPSVVPVDQGAADVHALSASLRWTPVDLRSAQNFDRVYRLDDLAAADANWRSHAGRGLRERGFVRFDSGLAAVFPQSTYRDVGGVLRAEVPPGTVFLIGMPTPERLASELGSSCSTRPTSPTPIQAASTATQRASLAAGGEDRSAAAGLADGLADGSGAFSIWTSKLVRDAMIHARLDEVAGNKLGPARTDRP